MHGMSMLYCVQNIYSALVHYDDLVQNYSISKYMIKREFTEKDLNTGKYFDQNSPTTHHHFAIFSHAKQ